jgi:predicted ArsR family transcriptional regulator
MAQLRWGARRSLDAIYADLADIIDLATDDPSTVRKLAHRITTRMREEIEPKLQRDGPAPPLEQRVEKLEKLIERLLDDHNEELDAQLR